MTAPAVCSMGEFGYVVRGEPDLDRACLLLASHRLSDPETKYSDPCELPPVYEAGWMRWTPCNADSCFDGGGHRGHLQTDQKPGRGAWWGVWFDWGWS